MARFTDDVAIKPRSKGAKKSIGDRFLETQARRQLHEQRAKRVTEHSDLRQELVEQRGCGNEPSDVGYRARDLD